MVIFQYDLEKDIWCLLNKGESSNNSQLPTKAYTELVAQYGESPTCDDAVAFIKNKNIDFQEYRNRFQKDWEMIAPEYHRRAELIFGVSLPVDVSAYLTINNRCPYSIENNSFFVSVDSSSARETIMHELWHFYTWYGLGADQEKKLGKVKYNDFKEALTVLLNIEYKDLMGEGNFDKGYPQHKELREQILHFWQNEKDIRKLWDHLIVSN